MATLLRFPASSALPASSTQPRRHRKPHLPTVGLLLAVLLLLQPTQSLSAWLRGPGRRAAKQCRRISTEYRPSALEAYWGQHVVAWSEPKTFCRVAGRFKPNVTYWLDANARLMATQHPHLRGEPQENHVFSSFVTTYQCRDGSSHTRTAWIEPLAFALRHPAAPCDPKATEDRSYLLLASAGDYKPHPHTRQNRTPSCAPQSGPRAFLFDMGASTWSKGMGGPSQSFLIEAYRTRGIEFDRILLWEAEPQSAKDIYRKVPRELHKVYQYMNIPVNTDRGDPGNPLNILKDLTACEDFVAVKLDIDTPLLENEFIQQILEDSEISSRIDEFYFEQHVNFVPMLPNWKRRIDKSKTLADSYKLFAELRRRGIRAHGWP